MIDELIEKEKNTLIQKMQQYRELNSNLVLLKEKLKQLEEERTEIENEIIMNSEPYEPVHKEYNLFQRLFSREYKVYVRKHEEYKEQSEIFQRKKETMQNQLKSLKNEISQIQDEISTDSHTLSNLNIEEIEEHLTLLGDKETAIELLLKKHPEHSKNLEFMREAINVKVDFIQYDNTNNPELYIEVIEKTKQKYIDKKGTIDGNAEYYERFKNEIIVPENVEEGTYKVPTQYIYEAVRSSFISGNCTLLEYICKYFEVNGKVSKEFGEQMQAMWEDEDTYFAVHGIIRNFEASDGRTKDIDDAEKTVNSIFRQGLKATNSMSELRDKNRTPKIEATAFVQGKLNFISALGYNYAR